MSCTGSQSFWSRFSSAFRRSRAKLAGCAAAVCLAGALLGQPRARGRRPRLDSCRSQRASTSVARWSRRRSPSVVTRPPTPLRSTCRGRSRSTAPRASSTSSCICAWAGTVARGRLDRGNAAPSDDRRQRPRLRYDMFRNAARTQVWGDTIAQPPCSRGSGPIRSRSRSIGRVPALQNVQSGSYADTVVATLFF